jgi:hypothetical protein
MMIKKILNLKKKEQVETDTRGWQIYVIKEGLRCEHLSGKYIEYFEFDELLGQGSFEGSEGMTPLDVFARMMYKTPYTRGFIYKRWNLLNHEGKGFIITPRLIDNKKVIEDHSSYVNYSNNFEEEQDRNYLIDKNEERYRTNESLKDIYMLAFLQIIEES